MEIELTKINGITYLIENDKFYRCIGSPVSDLVTYAQLPETHRNFLENHEAYTKRIRTIQNELDYQSSKQHKEIRTLLGV